MSSGAPSISNGSCARNRRSGNLELEPKHELDLPRQPGTCVRGSGVVVVIVEIVGRVDKTQCSYWLEYPFVGYRVPPAIHRLLIIEGKIIKVRVTKLGVIEDVEQLHAELGGNTLSYFSLLGESYIDLPGVERPDEAVGSVAKSAYESTSVGAYTSAWVVRTRRFKRRRGERGRIDRDRLIVYPSRQKQGNARNKVWSLRGLVIGIGQL
jgi:hypothetical protein